MKRVFLTLATVAVGLSASAADKQNLSVFVTPNVQTLSTIAVEQQSVTGISMLIDLVKNRSDVQSSESNDFGRTSERFLRFKVLDEPNLKLTIEKNRFAVGQATLTIETGAPLNQVRKDFGVAGKQAVRITGRLAERLYTILKEGGAKLNGFGHYSVHGSDAIYGSHREESDIACGPDFGKIKRIQCVIH